MSAESKNIIENLRIVKKSLSSVDGDNPFVSFSGFDFNSKYRKVRNILIYSSPYMGNGDIELATKLAIKFAKTKQFKVGLCINWDGLTQNSTISREQIKRRIDPFSKTLSLMEDNEKEMIEFNPETFIAAANGLPNLKFFKNLKFCYFVPEYNGSHYQQSRALNEGSILHLSVPSGFKNIGPESQWFNDIYGVANGVLTLSHDEIQAIPDINKFMFPKNTNIPIDVQKLLSNGIYFFGYANSLTGRGTRKAEYMMAIIDYLNKRTNIFKNENVVFVFPGEIKFSDCPIHWIKNRSKTFTLYSLSEEYSDFLDLETEQLKRNHKPFPYTIKGNVDNGPHVHIITGKMDHDVFLMFMKHSKAPFVLATGDQSAVEAWSLKKFVFYEEIHHKKLFYRSFHEYFHRSSCEAITRNALIPDYSFDENLTLVKRISEIMVLLDNSDILNDYQIILEQALARNDLFSALYREIIELSITSNSLINPSRNSIYSVTETDTLAFEKHELFWMKKFNDDCYALNFELDYNKRYPSGEENGYGPKALVVYKK